MSSRKSDSRIPYVTFSLLIVVMAVLLFPLDSAWKLLVTAMCGIVLIVSDEKTSLEKRLESRLHVPMREYWVPLALLAGLILAGALDLGNLGETIRTKGDIVLFILSFALVAEGLSQSGFVSFLAYRVAERCGGDTQRLILYLFVLASALTYVTSNDIVVLALTPIVFSVALHAKIYNAQVLLLTQFVAANTVSMGLIIGSPTNIIVGDIARVDSFTYAAIMAIPTIYAFIVTFLVVDTLNNATTMRGNALPDGGVIKRLSFGSLLPRTWVYRRHYPPPVFASHRLFTREMRRWITLFGLIVAFFAVNTVIEAPLYMTTVFILLATTATRLYERRLPTTTHSHRILPITSMPWGIVPFALTYFAIIDALLSFDFIVDNLILNVSELALWESPLASIASIGIAGIGVNLFNDLPASVLAGELFKLVDFETWFDEIRTLMAFLTGLNIGTYVTPVGALAGIIWFANLTHLKQQTLAKDGFEVQVPRRLDLVIYGAICFVASTVLLGIVQYAWVGILNLFLGPSDSAFRVDGFGPWYLFCPSLAITVLIPFIFRRRLKRNGVGLLHLADIFAAVTRVRFWILGHRISFVVLSASIIFTVSALSIVWVEHQHSILYGTEALFDDFIGFATWFGVFAASGFEQELFPNSVGGVALGAMTALAAIGTIVYLGRVGSSAPMRNLRERIALGDIPGNRLALVNVSREDIQLLDALRKRSGAFLTCVVHDDDIDEIENYFGSFPNRGAAFSLSRIHMLQTTGGRSRPSRPENETRIRPGVDLVSALAMHTCNQIFFLSRSAEEDLQNLVYLQELEESFLVVNSFARESIEAYESSAKLEEMNLPEVVVRLSSTSAKYLIDVDALPEVSNQLILVPGDEELTKYLTAELSPQIDELARYYAIADANDMIEVRGTVCLDRFSFDPSIEQEIGTPEDASDTPGVALVVERDRKQLIGYLRRSSNLPPGHVVCGVEVDLGDSWNRMTIDDYLSKGRGERLRALISVCTASNGRRRSDTPLEMSTPVFDAHDSLVRPYIVAGEGANVFRLLTELASIDALQLIALVPSSCYVPRVLVEDARIELILFDEPVQAAMAAMDRAQSGARIAVFDNDEDSEPWLESFLNRISDIRLDRTNRGREHLVTLYTSDKALLDTSRRYYVDNTVNTSSASDSYFYSFVEVLYSHIGTHPLYSHEAERSRGVRLAHETAMALSPYVVRRCSAFEGRGYVRGATVSSFLRTCQEDYSFDFEVVAVVRLELAGDEAGVLAKCIIEVLGLDNEEVESPRLRSNDLVLGISHL